MPRQPLDDRGEKLDELLDAASLGHPGLTRLRLSGDDAEAERA
jgi:hypothetical protein